MIAEIKKRGDKMELSKQLLEFRAKHNLTQAQLAKIVGVTTNTIFRYENEKNRPHKIRKIQILNKMKEWEEK
jgi:DNA-binding XRE family transcriptional regulator